MGKYIKLFETHDDYLHFTETEDFVLPNVSYCEDRTDEVHYNPIAHYAKYMRNGEIVGSPIEICFTTEKINDVNDEQRHNKGIGYYNCEGSWAYKAIEHSNCGTCDRIEVDMFKGGISNITVDTSQCQDSIGDNYEYGMNGNVFWIAAKQGTWDIGCFLHLVINYTYNNEEFCNLITINNCD